MKAPRVDAAKLVVAAGVAAALHVGKLPTAIPVLRDALGISLVEAGFLLSLVQFAGMFFGLLAGLVADGIGLKRTMVTGLAVLALASAAGAFAQGPLALMVLRALEGAGVLLTAMPAPGLIRRLVAADRVNAALGMWGAYMPLGTAIALLAGAPAIALFGWQGWWVLLAAVAAAMAVMLSLSLPPDERTPREAPRVWLQRVARTLRSGGAWLVSLTFCVYSAQWLAVIGFLPTVYGQAGFDPATAGAATAFAALVNMIGNVSAGRLLQRAAPPPMLLAAGFVAMGAGALAAFGGDGVLVRYAGVILFSMLGGLVPGTLFSLAVRLAPGESTVSTTVGWMQQWSSFGQFAGPPLVAWVASRAGGWQFSGAVTAAFALAGLLLAGCIALLLRSRAARI